MIGKGNVELVFTFGKKITLANVLHVPDMNMNLASGDLLGEPRIKSMYESGKLILTRSGSFIGKGYSCDGMVKLCIDDVINNKNATSAYMLDSIDIWHSKLAHIGISTMKRMIKCGLFSCDTNNFFF